MVARTRVPGGRQAHDNASRELLDLMVERVQRLPVLLMVTCRPEFQEGWSGRPHVTMLTLKCFLRLVRAREGMTKSPGQRRAHDRHGAIVTP